MHAASHPSDTGWLVGRARVDITGEPWGAGMMGYAAPGQRSHGILTRQFARALIFDDGERTVAWVVADIGMFFQGAVDAIVRRLHAVTRGRFDASNIVLTATHTHCGPGGYSTHVLYNLTTAGFHRRTFDRLVDGIVSAVLRADNDREPAEMTYAQSHLTNAGVNRSPSAFDRNPVADRQAHRDRIDPLTTLVLVTTDAGLRAVINWFAVHNTSMSNRTTLISSDNKGWAARLWETQAGTDMVAAFAQTNAGDISPNLGGKQRCGPTGDEFANNRIIAERQLAAAHALASGKATTMPPIIDYRLMYVDMDRQHTADGYTSSAMLGASFAAGTSDGRGSPLFRQGKHNLIPQLISRIIYRTNRRLAHSQAPKDVILPAGALRWVQQRLPIQLIRLGSLYLVCLPVEVTVTAGLRIRQAVSATAGARLDEVLIQGYSNGYAHYLTTEYEYDEQRYEGASTVFGRYELSAIIDASRTLTESLVAGTRLQHGPVPRPPRWIVPSPAGSPLWARRQRIAAMRWSVAAHTGQDVVAEFAADHPNAPIREQYLRVERQQAGSWMLIADDASLNTRIRWYRTRGRFYAYIVWTVPDDLSPGRLDDEFRIGYIAADHTVYTPGFKVTPAPR